MSRRRIPTRSKHIRLPDLSAIFREAPELAAMDATYRDLGYVRTSSTGLMVEHALISVRIVWRRRSVRRSATVECSVRVPYAAVAGAK